MNKLNQNDEWRYEIRRNEQVSEKEELKFENKRHSKNSANYLHVWLLLSLLCITNYINKI